MVSYWTRAGRKAGLVLAVTWKHSELFPFHPTLAGGLVQTDFVVPRCFISIPAILKAFCSREGMLSFIKCLFCIYRDDPVFSLDSADGMYFIYWFAYILITLASLEWNSLDDALWSSWCAQYCAENASICVHRRHWSVVPFFCVLVWFS